MNSRPSQRWHDKVISILRGAAARRNGCCEPLAVPSPSKTVKLNRIYLENFATRAGVSMDTLLSKGIQSRLYELVDSTPRQWMPREQWDALVRGEQCPLCEAIALTELTNEYGITIANLNMGRLRLNANQGVNGYCVLICHKHVREPYELNPTDRALFFEDMMRAALALETVFQPVKMNFEILGNAGPHLHCHIKPRYYGDPAPGSPIWPDRHPHFLTPQELAERATLIKSALEKN